MGLFSVSFKKVWPFRPFSVSLRQVSCTDEVAVHVFFLSFRGQRFLKRITIICIIISTNMINNSSFASMKTRSQQPCRGMTEIASQQPRRGTTEIASRFNGRDKNAKRMRAVGTRLAPSFVAYLRGTPAAHLRLPAVKTAGYPCQMPTASALRNLRNLN